MMPRIDAGERLSAITNGAIATGSMAVAEATKIINRLEDEETGERRKVAKANPAALAMMGIAARGPEAPSEKGLSDG